jgi:hypothetical protein
VVSAAGRHTPLGGDGAEPAAPTGAAGAVEEEDAAAGAPAEAVPSVTPDGST